MSSRLMSELGLKYQFRRISLLTGFTVAVSFACLAASQVAIAAAGAFQQVDDSGISLEAESALRVAVDGASWTDITGADMSNSAGVYLDTLTHSFSRSGQGPSLSWTVSTPFKGTYAVWARMRTKDGDSLYSEFDGKAAVHHFVVADQWVWRKLRAVEMSAGQGHTLTVYARERRLEIDKVLFQVNGRGTPDGLGPIESAQIQLETPTTEPAVAALIEEQQPSVEVQQSVASQQTPSEETEVETPVEETATGETVLQAITNTPETIETAPLGSSSVFLQGPDGLVTLEAESALQNKLNGAWQEISDGSYSGGQALSLDKKDPNRTHYGEGPNIRWQVKAETSGDYKVWALMRNSGANSVYSNFDGDYGYQYFRSSKQWSWRAFYNRYVGLKAGEQHELQIWARDAGVDIDKVMLIPRNSSYVPDGAGPAESARLDGVAGVVASAGATNSVEVESVAEVTPVESVVETEVAEVVPTVEVIPEVVAAVEVEETVVEVEAVGAVEVEETPESNVIDQSSSSESEPINGIAGLPEESANISFFQGDDKVVSLEAESAIRSGINGSWNAIQSSSFSNGVAMTLDGVGSRLQYGSGPSLTWKIKAKYSGSYKLIALIRNNDSNSVFSNFDGDQGYQYFLSSRDWNWRLFWNRKIELVEGEEHSLEIQGRDPGVEIDKIVLVPEEIEYALSGTGPIESARNGDSVAGQTVASSGGASAETSAGSEAGSGSEIELGAQLIAAVSTASVAESVPEAAALTNAARVGQSNYPGTADYSKKFDLPSCDGTDALRISSASELSQINDSAYRVFCIAPGDYRSYGKLAIDGSGGTESEPKVIRFESAEFDSADEIFRADVSKLARMPQIDIRNTSHWVLHKLAFIDVSGQPIRIAGANDIVVDRIRLQNNRNGIEIQHGTNNSYIQNSLVADQVIPRGSGNDGVCIAMMGHYRQVNLNGNIDYDYPVVAKNNHVVNNEIVNCNDGFQAVWMPQFKNYPDFQGTIIAGNDIYIDNSRRTNCSGSLSWNGDCAYTENAMDFKAASLDASNPVEVYDNRMWGWRKTDSSYNGPANSWGTAISTHYNSMKNLQIFENVFFDVGAGVGFTRGSNNSIVRDNIFANVTSAGINNGVAIMTYTDSYDYDDPVYAYSNVKSMTVERNHLVNIGGSWLSTSAENSTFKCNVVSSGTWTATSGNWAKGLNAGQNTYYGTNSGSLSRGSDSVKSAGTSNMSELCFDVKRASVSGGEEVCLAGVLDTASSANVCASQYWTADNWAR